MSLYYLRIALRALLRQKAYSITTLVGLSLGMTSCLLILLFVVDELSYDQYHSQKDRIYRFATYVEGSTFDGIAKVNGPWGPAAKEAIPEIEAMTRFVMSGMSGQLLVGRGDRRFYESDGFYADSTVFRIFSYKFISGDQQTALTAPNSIVITKTFAQKYFGDEDALGQTLRIDNQQDYTVTGILEDVPSASHFTFSYLLSMASLQHPQRDNWIQWNQFYTYLLLRPGTDPAVVAKKLKTVLEKNLDKEIANSFTPFLQQLTDIHLRSHLHREINANSDVTYIYVFSSIALLILAISCANFINLSTAQASVRAKEIGVRKVNGAVKKQLAFQFLTETFLLCSFALVLAQILTVLALPVLNELTSKNLGINTLLNPVIIAGILGITFLTALLAGSYPALYQSALKPIQVLKGKWTPPEVLIFVKDW